LRRNWISSWAEIRQAQAMRRRRPGRFDGAAHGLQHLRWSGFRSRWAGHANGVVQPARDRRGSGGRPLGQSRFFRRCRAGDANHRVMLVLLAQAVRTRRGAPSSGLPILFRIAAEERRARNWARAVGGNFLHLGSRQAGGTRSGRPSEPNDSQGQSFSSGCKRYRRRQESSWVHVCGKKRYEALFVVHQYIICYPHSSTP